MNLDKLDDWIIARLGATLGKAVEGWLWWLGALIIAWVLGFRPS